MPNWREIITDEQRKAIEKVAEEERKRNAPKEKRINPREFIFQDLRSKAPGVMQAIDARGFLLSMQSQYLPATKFVQGTYGYMLKSEVFEEGFWNRGTAENPCDEISYQQYRYFLSVALKLHNDPEDDLIGRTRWINNGRRGSETVNVCVCPCLQIKFGRRFPDTNPLDSCFHETEYSRLGNRYGDYDHCVVIPDTNSLPMDKIDGLFRKVINEVQSDDALLKMKRKKTYTGKEGQAKITPSRPWYKRLGF